MEKKKQIKIINVWVVRIATNLSQRDPDVQNKQINKVGLTADFSIYNSTYISYFISLLYYIFGLIIFFFIFI